MTLPLYTASSSAAPHTLLGGAHPGLWFERFFSAWKNDYNDIDKDLRSSWLHGFRTAGEKNALQKHTTRITELVQSRSGTTRIYLCSGNFVSGLGNAHPLENGFTWHPTLGVPYLPGAAVKGLARAAVETAYSGADKTAILTRWFGSEDKDPEHVSENAGQFIFMDALPTTPCELHAEIMTPHMGKWYEQGEKKPGQADTMPGDWHSPNPVSYLVARQLSLLFAIIPRTPDAEKELDDVWDALSHALQHLGAGAKTAIGFGAMQRDAKKEKEQLKAAEAQREADENAKKEQARQEAKKQLSPAMQQVSDFESTCEKYKEKIGSTFERIQKGSGFYPVAKRLRDAAAQGDWSAEEKAAAKAAIERWLPEIFGAKSAKDARKELKLGALAPAA